MVELVETSDDAGLQEDLQDLALHSGHEEDGRPDRHAAGTRWLPGK